MSWYDYYPRYKPARPKKNSGGIKSQSKRGFGTSWWAKRWIQVLESFNIGQRLGRGRSYARRGQVVSIAIEKGKIKARVQGTQPHPYSISIAVKTLSNSDWKKLARELSSQAIFAAKLLSGEMPSDIEKVFDKAGLSLFPNKYNDLTTDCSCPDWSNPCKHIAAVYYLLGEEFDRDPFLIFKLRGIERDEFMGLMGNESQKTGQSFKADDKTEKTEPKEALSCIPSLFWEGQEPPEDPIGEVHAPPVVAALPKRLGNFPFWRGEENFLDSITPVYKQMSPIGMKVFLGEEGTGRNS